MNTLKSTLCAALAATLLLPGLAVASMIWHPANDEAGYTYHPDHFISTLTRAEVQAETRQATRDGPWRCLASERGECATDRAAGSAKTRDEVAREVLSMAPAEKRQLRQNYPGG